MKNFKKILCVLLIVAIVAAMAVAFTACNDESKPVAKAINISLTDEQYAFCVNKSDATLLGQVNTFLSTIKANGTFDTIVDRYFGDGTPQGVTSATYNAAATNQLVVATNAAFEPFEYMNGDKFYGIDMELAKALADNLGKELVIKNIAFNSIFSEIEAGNADIGMAGITVNATREAQVQFTSSYYNASQVVVTKYDDTTFDNCTTVADVEAILNALTSSNKIGYQNGTTGNFYVEGDADWGFTKLPATGKGYETAALAITDMVNGNIDYVIVDVAPANKIVEKMNKLG